MKKINYMAPGAEPDKFYVLVYKKVAGEDAVHALVGTRTGRPFADEDRAAKRAEQIERDSQYTTVVVPVSDQYTTDSEK